MERSTKSALLDIIADIDSDMGGGAKLNSYVLIWDGPLGFVVDVREEDKGAFAQRLREMANSLTQTF